ncbi:iron-sulfur cluster-binding oxidoreductase [Oryzomonas japonica]|uniref:Iron-sulfur cluster-binding oxidoreductase n=1 Tax=Oryzomonas japonica TaxID=2603858 RepID=A0A7J4ZT00_9BACT|nr:iron-sulfur cluster-binding oxidoreductase [Oryzomonas japonica]KAB0666570.1 iron-sulfur cluster-binding oxidoreductase [Oryzomonas japonica]
MTHPGCGCPGSMARTIEQPEPDEGSTVRVRSELRQWPVQLHLIPSTASYLQDADLLISADCVAYAMGGMHQDLLKGKALAIACPKLDDTTPYVEKLAGIFSTNAIKSITVAIMEVPCCRGLDILVREALARSGQDTPLECVVIGVNGERRN